RRARAQRGTHSTRSHPARIRGPQPHYRFVAEPRFVDTRRIDTAQIRSRVSRNRRTAEGERPAGPFRPGRAQHLHGATERSVAGGRLLSRPKNSRGNGRHSGEFPAGGNQGALHERRGRGGGTALARGAGRFRARASETVLRSVAEGWVRSSGGAD